MKGIILAGGAGTRLHPVTKAVNKHLLPIYDKPMVYYPLSTLVQAGIKDILLITTPKDLTSFVDLLGDGSQWGIKLEYTCQPKPNGISEAFLIAHRTGFIKDEPVTLILGDNIFWGHKLINYLKTAIMSASIGMSTVFGYEVADPERYGVVKLDENDYVIDIIEKPTEFVSNYAVIGLYCFNSDVYHCAKQVKPSDRGELEISTLNKIFLDRGELTVELINSDDGVAWLDTGTHDSLLQASHFVETIQKRTGMVVGKL